jgi:signal transduction histidine kinase
MTPAPGEITREGDSRADPRPYRDAMRTPRPVDLAGAAVLAAAGQAEVWWGDLGAISTPAVAATLLAAGTVTAWHRLAPITVLGLALTFGALGPALLGVDPDVGFVPAIILIGTTVSAGYHARRPVLALLFGLVAVAGIVTVGHRGLSFADILYACLLVTGAWTAGRALASRTLRAELSEQRAAQAEREAAWHAAAAVADERLRIARELHDAVAHSISVMTLHVGGVRRLLLPEQQAERDALVLVERTGRESVAEMRRLLGVLRAPPGEPDSGSLGLARVDELLEPARAAGLHAELSVTGEARSLPPGLDLSAYRIVQEAVTNVLRHAAATRVWCDVTYRPDAVELRIADDGRGGEHTGSGGHGHLGMRERVALYGGSLSVGPGPDRGYLVTAVVPVP